jgi:Ca-activated chloride channel homolog
MRSRVIVLALFFHLAGAVGAEEPFATIVSPTPEPASGRVTFAAEVEGKDIVKVEMLVDGVLVGTLSAPPYSIEVELTDENHEHRFEVLAHNAQGEVGRALVMTAAIRVDDKVSAELQQVYITVSRDGQRVLDLEQSDFRVLDEGLRQEIVTFSRGEVPLAGALLIDASASMRGGRLRSALRGADAFLRGLRDQDETTLLLFSDRLLYSTPFSSDPQTLQAGLAGVEANGGTALSDFLYLAVKRLEERQGRRVVVVLSDGIDSHSALRAPELEWLIKRSRAMIYWIRTEAKGGEEVSRSSAWKNPQTYTSEYKTLVKAVNESGGRIVDVAGIEQAENAFREILAELREQYVIGYYPKNRRNDSSWRRVTVEPQRSGLDLRMKPGYIDY